MCILSLGAFSFVGCGSILSGEGEGGEVQEQE